MIQTVKVVHKWTQDASGRARVENAKPIIQRIDAVYLGGKVRTISGDVWDVVPNDNKKEADFVTVVQRHKAA